MTNFMFAEEQDLFLMHKALCEAFGHFARKALFGVEVPESASNIISLWERHEMIPWNGRIWYRDDVGRWVGRKDD